MLPVPHPGLAGARMRLLSRDDMVARDFGGDVTRLEATITDNYIDGSDPTLQVRAPDGVNWTIELAGHARNRSAGLTESRALPGDPVRIIGRRLHHLTGR